MMDEPKPGEIVTDGRNVTIGAPVCKATAGPATPSQALGNVLRHLKGVVASAEELKAIMEQEEKKQ